MARRLRTMSRRRKGAVWTLVGAVVVLLVTAAVMVLRAAAPPDELTVRPANATIAARPANPAPGPGDGPPGAPSAPESAAPPSDARCPVPTTGAGCPFDRRLSMLDKYLRGRPGVTAIVVRDRRTGASWQNRHAGRPIWTASTIKLAIAVDLLERHRLPERDRTLLAAMLERSDDLAANELWSRYGGADIATRFADYGMPGATFVDGLPHRWGSMKCTAADLDGLLTYVLERAPTAVRATVMGHLRNVAPGQRWGVWGAGHTTYQAGNKNGWWGYSTGWVINSAGFLGPDGRWTLTLMNDLEREGGYADGVETTTNVARILFGGPPAGNVPTGPPD